MFTQGCRLRSGLFKKSELTLKALGLCANNPFRVETNDGLRLPRVVATQASLQPWAGISERLRRWECAVVVYSSQRAATLGWIRSNPGLN